jgi:hypothetical protein
VSGELVVLLVLFALLMIILICNCLLIYHMRKADEHLQEARKYLNEAIKFAEIMKK